MDNNTKMLEATRFALDNKQQERIQEHVEVIASSVSSAMNSLSYKLITIEGFTAIMTSVFVYLYVSGYRDGGLSGKMFVVGEQE